MQTRSYACMSYDILTPREPRRVLYRRIYISPNNCVFFSFFCICAAADPPHNGLFLLFFLCDYYSHPQGPQEPAAEQEADGCVCGSFLIFFFFFWFGLFLGLLVHFEEGYIYTEYVANETKKKKKNCSDIHHPNRPSKYLCYVLFCYVMFIVMLPPPPPPPPPYSSTSLPLVISLYHFILIDLIDFWTIYVLYCYITVTCTLYTCKKNYI